MSPFSVALRQLRAELELAQGEFAARLGCRQAYISALECGTQLPKDDELIHKMVDVLGLSSAQETMLRQAYKLSRRFHLPPLDAPSAAFNYFVQISEALPNLTSADFKALSAVLDSMRRAGQSRATPDAPARCGTEKETPM
jgi:transcriptional regulator with XRE-family HTH domain